MSVTLNATVHLVERESYDGPGETWGAYSTRQMADGIAQALNMYASRKARRTIDEWFVRDIDVHSDSFNRFPIVNMVDRSIHLDTGNILAERRRQYLTPPGTTINPWWQWQHGWDTGWRTWSEWVGREYGLGPGIETRELPRIIREHPTVLDDGYRTDQDVIDRLIAREALPKNWAQPYGVLTFCTITNHTPSDIDMEDRILRLYQLSAEARQQPLAYPGYHPDDNDPPDNPATAWANQTKIEVA